MANRRKDRPVPEGYTRYTGEYEKWWYDIITIHGNKYQDCWPNAGTFSTGHGTRIMGDAVFAIKKVPDDPYLRERKNGNNSTT